MLPLSEREAYGLLLVVGGIVAVICGHAIVEDIRWTIRHWKKKR